MNLTEYYEYLHSQKLRESANINTRLTWGLTAQGFLFAALALVQDGTSAYDALRIALPMVGGTIALASLCGSVGALISLRHLESEWARIAKDNSQYFPKPYAQGLAHFLGNIPATLVPGVLLAAWVYLAIELIGKAA